MITQNLYPPEDQKNQEWCQSVAIDISMYAQTSIQFNRERYKTFRNYDYIMGNYEMGQFSYMTEPFGIATPGTWRHYDLIRVKYEKIVGDYLEQPLTYGAHITNREGHERKVETAAKVAAEKLLAPIMKMVKQATGVDTTDPSVNAMPPQDQIAALNMSKKDLIELFGENALDYLINRYNIDKEYVKCLWDMCISSKAFTYTRLVNGYPLSTRVDPRSMIYDVDLDNDTLDNSAWQAYERFLTPNQILQEYRNYLTPKQVAAIKGMTRTNITSLIRKYPSYVGFYRITNDAVRIRVIHCVWNSLRDMAFKVSPNKYNPDDPILQEISEEDIKNHPKWYKSQKKKGEDKIKIASADDWWEATMIGNDLFTKCQRMNDQPRSQSWGLALSKSPYKGVIKDPIDGITQSLTDRLEPWQNLWNEVMFNVDFLLGRTNGNVMIYDDALRPESLTRPVVISMAKNHGIAFVDSRKDGVRPNAFTQFSAVNMSNTADISVLLNVANQIENIVDATTGLNRGWTGTTKASDTLGNTQNNVLQANSVIRPTYQAHATVVEQSLNGMADLLKYSSFEETGAYSYVIDDGTRKAFVVPDGFRLDDLGIKYKTGFAEKAKMDKINAMIMQALSSGAIDFEHWVDTIDVTTAAELKAIFKQGLDVMKQNNIARQNAEMQQEHEKNVASAARGNASIEVSKINAEAAIAVANIKEKAESDRNMYDKAVENALLSKKGKQSLDEIAYNNLFQSQKEELPSPPTFQYQSQTQGDTLPTNQPQPAAQQPQLQQ